MTRLLVVHHSPTPHLRALAGAVLEGARHPDIAGVEVVERPALEAHERDVLDADGYLLGTPANLGYMSGALKHFFDTVYDACIDTTAGRPWGMWIHGSSDTAGARLGIERIVTGLQWRAASEPVELIGEEPGELDRCNELGSVLAATLGAF
ncbi:MAG: flavodoxin family protein [Actinomycetia bacterium]|nr:flavodoxin family protein [Actinomycetes bacterium]